MFQQNEKTRIPLLVLTLFTFISSLPYIGPFFGLYYLLFGIACLIVGPRDEIDKAVFGEALSVFGFVNLILGFIYFQALPPTNNFVDVIPRVTVNGILSIVVGVLNMIRCPENSLAISRN